MDDLKYQILIYTFIASVPIHLGNFLLSDNIGYSFLFSGLMLVAIGLVILFGYMQREHRPRNFTQNMLTFGNLILVAGSSINLFIHVFGL